MRNKHWQSSCGLIELKYKKSEYTSIPVSGDADDAINELLQKDSILAKFALIPDSLMVKVLSEYGAWNSDELHNRKDNIKRLLWLSCCDLNELE